MNAILLAIALIIVLFSADLHWATSCIVSYGCAIDELAKNWSSVCLTALTMKKVCKNISHALPAALTWSLIVGCTGAFFYILVIGYFGYVLFVFKVTCISDASNCLAIEYARLLLMWAWCCAFLVPALKLVYGNYNGSWNSSDRYSFNNMSLGW